MKCQGCAYFGQVGQWDAFHHLTVTDDGDYYTDQIWLKNQDGGEEIFFERGWSTPNGELARAVELARHLGLLPEEDLL
jgi:hypothetical protein